eukprot:1394108-Amorphochlora_amoeboformis.AAC.2
MSAPGFCPKSMSSCPPLFFTFYRFCPLLPASARFCPLLPASARFCPLLPASARFCLPSRVTRVGVIQL